MHQDNAPPYTSMLVLEFLAKNKTVIMSQSPNSQWGTFSSSQNWRQNDDLVLLKKFITGDESWVYGYDIETKIQSSRFAAIEEIKEKLKQEMSATP